MAATYIGHYDSPLGGITVASDGEVVCGLWFDGQKYFGSSLAGDPAQRDDAARDLPVFGKVRRWLDLYFAGADPGFTPPLALRGTPFRREVWDVLRAIPYGQTTTYGAVAAEIARRRGLDRMSSQAVGGAVGHNPVSIIVPCHRVVGSDGSLTGYAGGIDKKVRLLELEGADMTGLYIPTRGTAL